MKRRLIWLVAAVVIFLPAHLQGSDFRSILVDAWSWGSGYAIISPTATQATVDQIKSWNCNVILMQVRKRCDAYYTSSLEPAGTDPSPEPGYDPLEDMIAKAHAAGLEVHTWVVPYRVWTTTVPPPHTTPEHIYYLHPEWFSQYANGDTLWDGRYTSLDPALPAVEDYLIQVFKDIVSRYDIDGFLLDYIRYYDIGWGYNPVAVAKFNAEYGRTGMPSSTDPLWQEWRRDQVSNLVKRTYLEIKALKPHVKVGALVWRTAASGRSEVLQDWERWMQNHWLDYASPMNYTTDNATFNANSLDSVGRAYGHHIYMGVDGEKNTISTTIWQIQNARDIGFPGMHLYSYAHPNSGTPDPDGFKEALLNGPYPTASPVPEMPWLKTPSKGYLKGFILNTDGTPVYPATATITEIGMSDKNSGTGFYGFSEIAPGTYTLRVEAPGYIETERQVTVVSGQVSSLDVTLEHEDVPPIISSVRAANVQATHAQIKWDTDEPSTSQVDFGHTPEYGSTTLEDTARTTSHTVQLTGLSPYTTYHFRVRSHDAAGNVTESADYAFTTANYDEPAEIIIDNLDDACRTYGVWWAGTAASGKYGSNYFYTTTADHRRYATFTPQILSAGNYDVYIWYTSGTNRSTRAKWRVYYDGGMEEYTVNEQINGGRWNLLARDKPFAAGTSGYVATYSGTGDTSTLVIIADAVKFVPSAKSVAQAKFRPDGMSVVLSHKRVSAVFANHFYICEDGKDQVCGVRVNSPPPPEGSYVDVLGVMSTVNGERVIVPSHIESSPGPGPPDPLLMLTKSVGGAPPNPYTPGITNGIGANNTGLLIMVVGRLIPLGNSFAVDDGSGQPLEIDCTALSNPLQSGCIAVVVGISGTKLCGENIVPIIKPRRDADIRYP